MKSFVLCSLIALLLIDVAVVQVRADCDETKGPDESDFKHFFKSLSCKVKQGAEDVAEVAKPYTDKIGEGAKDFGSSVAQKYDELKHRLSDDTSSPKPPSAVPFDAPTEKVPLAPIAPSHPPAL
ncbi:GL16381 [Drosophila persimilis]|uniref:Uncharacterized protein n=2 Tax=pseudoobscura subgroup TaxID=32358 RepID=Q29FX1_DROPS|nr:uncharacterized protein LOC4814387 [Drosophila pseudoobscura]XP_002023049.1 uncharacterized protein LOC6597889 [Drosophila persimilis]XP_033248369.1 uncharacterized protein LOC108165405 [Drosophila miranda]EDW27154.1 GL16381 [Drosophila persimilis]